MRDVPNNMIKKGQVPCSQLELEVRARKAWGSSVLCTPGAAFAKRGWLTSPPFFTPACLQVVLDALQRKEAIMMDVDADSSMRVVYFA